ncbi:hydroxymethylbilane synthase [Pseudobutyrivibrio sp. YE44]|uniref:hydroxymethylbilane synthase n=1 Tax=Pseudobutyrivibrio sp. YE44 TaxID=1520802 RepID=UPI000883D81F|nr:hydroxymethylbilane synthase [Pseudobutyrivibrio sp. YE44]SDB14278.1 hydroxymethylbilane synthase [Pseudobutyrivibrio sp. YE44]
MHIKIGTRGSKLALAQTNYVIEKLKKAFPENEYEVVIIKTTGDKDQTRPLDQIGSKGLFVDEIERALLADEIQLAVHSMKDMPSEQPEGLTFAKSWKREDARDVLILKEGKTLSDLPKGANVATGSKRRSYQLLKLRPDINIFPIRGNIDTRINKLKNGLADGTRLDGIILAAAGLNRLSIENENLYYFDIDEMIPSPAQGTLAIEIKSANTKLLEMVNSLSDEVTNNISFLERGFLEKIGGDCHLPIGAYASKEEEGYVLKTLFGNEDGSKLATAVVSAEEPTEDMIDKAVEDIRKQLED